MQNNGKRTHMNEKQQTGKQGEDLACAYLHSCGYRVLARNFRCKAGEIDIIAYADRCVHFAEVKTRSSLRYGLPVEAVDTRKIRHIYNAARTYLAQYPRYAHCDLRMDVLEVLLSQAHVEIRFWENAFTQEDL